MGLLRRVIASREPNAGRDFGHLRLVPCPEPDYEEVGYGRETQIIGSRAACADPYAAWLEQQADRELQVQPQVRWVHKHRQLDPAAAAAPAAGEQDGRPQIRWVHHYRGAARPESGARTVARRTSRPLAGV